MRTPLEERIAAALSEEAASRPIRAGHPADAARRAGVRRRRHRFVASAVSVVAAVALGGAVVLSAGGAGDELVARAPGGGEASASAIGLVQVPVPFDEADGWIRADGDRFRIAGHTSSDGLGWEPTDAAEATPVVGGEGRWSTEGPASQARAVNELTLHLADGDRSGTLRLPGEAPFTVGEVVAHAGAFVAVASSEVVPTDEGPEMRDLWLFHSVDGRTWEPVRQVEGVVGLIVLHHSGPELAVAVVAAEPVPDEPHLRIIRSPDGRNWAPPDLGPAIPLGDPWVSASAAGTWWIAHNHGDAQAGTVEVLRSTDAGRTWTTAMGLGGVTGFPTLAADGPLVAGVINRGWTASDPHAGPQVTVIWSTDGGRTFATEALPPPGPERHQVTGGVTLIGTRLAIDVWESDVREDGVAGTRRRLLVADLPGPTTAD